jgi:hypothetical protein
VLETRSHADGQYLDRRTLLRGGRGHPVGLYAPLHMTGLPRDTSINRTIAVGREIPEPTPAAQLEAEPLFVDAIRRMSRLVFVTWLARRARAHGGLAMSVARSAALISAE